MLDKAQQKKALEGRIPLVVGVAGHIDLRPDDVARLRDEVAEIFARIKRDYLGDDSKTPVIVLSALAEGADRLVADVAHQHGIALIAPLPMEETEYRKDFAPDKAQEPDSDNNFQRLRDLSLASFTVRHPLARADTPLDPKRDRDMLYQAVGIYIVQHCHVLIALWNGDGSNEKTGGTAQIVSFKRDGIPMELSPSASSALDGSEIGPVIEVTTPRKSDDDPRTTVSTKPWGIELTGRSRPALSLFKGLAGYVDKIFGHVPHPNENQERRTWRVFEAIVDQTRRFNAEVAASEPAKPDRANPDKCLENLFKDSSNAINAAALAQAKRTAPAWCDLYKHAEVAAQYRQGKFIRDWRLLFWAGFVTIAVFETYAHLLPDDTWLLLVYAAVLLSAFGYFIAARYFEHQERFLDFRALAEALRIAVYWKLAGIATPVADAYPIKQVSELAWVKIVLRAIDMLQYVDRPPTETMSASSLAEVRTLWVQGQRDYFDRQGKNHHRKAEVWEARSLALLALSPIGAIFLYFYQHHEHPIIVGIGLAAGIAAILAGYVEKIAHHATARQYDRMQLVFDHALKLVPKAFPNAMAAEVERLYIELGREAMKENAEWVAIYRQRPIRPAG